MKIGGRNYQSPVSRHTNHVRRVQLFLQRQSFCQNVIQLGKIARNITLRKQPEEIDDGVSNIRADPNFLLLF